MAISFYNLRYRAWRRAADRAYNAAIAGEVTPEEHLRKMDRLREASRRRESVKQGRAMLALAGIHIKDGAML